MKLEEWQELQKKQRKEEQINIPSEKFFGRKDELAQLHAFVEHEMQKVFFLYGVPMIGKSTLVREFCKSLSGYQQVRIQFTNPENPETTLEKRLAAIDLKKEEKLFVIIENFEEALQWTGNAEHLHEVKYPKVKQFIQSLAALPSVKLLLESRFHVKNDFLPVNADASLSSRQLGKMDRKELFAVLNEIYRHNSASFESFEQLCDGLNDHIWLIELAMQNAWLYEDILEAAQRSESLTKKLWEKIRVIIRKLPAPEQILLCGFSIINPISEQHLKTHFEALPTFSKKDELSNALLSLRKKLLLVYDAKQQQYELNPFLREVCFTYLREHKGMRVIEQIPFFSKAEKPVYDELMQAQEQSDYGTFYRLIHNLQKQQQFEKVHEVLSYVKENDTVINKQGVLNEIGITYKLQQNYPEAIRYLEEAYEAGNIHSYNELAIVYKELKDLPQAIEYLEKACKAGNIHSYNELAIIYKELKNYPKAIKTLEEALEKEPKNVRILNELAIVYKELKDYPSAIETLDRALVEEPANVKVLTESAIVYKELKDYPKAIAALNKALKEEPKNVKSLNELAIVYLKLGELKPALAQVRLGLKYAPGDRYLKFTLSRINEELSKPQAKHPAKQKILFIAANPTDEASLQTDQEYRIIKAEMRSGSQRDAFEFLPPQLAVTIQELIRAVNAKPQIIHFSGHGETDGILITTDDNRSIVFPIPAMERLFKPLKGSTRIVILNSCYSAAQAELISGYGIYVIGHNLPIGDKAAIDFAKGFYIGLSEGKNCEDAFNDAMVIVLAESPEYAAVIEVWKDGVKLAL